jgi:hypothetical protein
VTTCIVDNAEKLKQKMLMLFITKGNGYLFYLLEYIFQDSNTALLYN